jgi:hypothetical protein
MNQIELNRKILDRIEWDEDSQTWYAETPFGGGISNPSLFDTIIALNRAIQAAAPEFTVTARPLPILWLGEITGWRAQIEVNGFTLLIGYFATEQEAQTALDKFLTPTMETP